MANENKKTENPAKNVKPTPLPVKETRSLWDSLVDRVTKFCRRCGQRFK